MNEKHYVESSGAHDAALTDFLRRFNDDGAEIGPSLIICEGGGQRLLYEISGDIKASLIMSQKNFPDLRDLRFYVSTNEEPPREWVCGSIEDEKLKKAHGALCASINNRLRALSDKIDAYL